jgi:serine/threonine protein phosphatase 1
MKNILIIGDIHGCFYELQALLDKSGLSDGDEVIGIGDIVDRGPETPQVVDFFRTTPNARSIMGNHERKHVRAARHEVILSISQQISKIQLGSTYPAALEWMSILPLSIELPDALLIHGYFEPGIASEFQNPMILCGTMGGQKILRERYDRPWYELYNADKPIIVGHENYTNSDQPFVYRDKVFGLDTNCVTGKDLTGILLPSF